MKSKKALICAASGACVLCQAAPQKIVTTSTAVKSGPPRYVIFAAGTATAAPSIVGCTISSGKKSGTIRIGSLRPGTTS